MTLNLVPTERSCQKYTHAKYEGCKSYQSKDMAKVKVFPDKQMEKRTHRPTDGQKLYLPPIYRCGGIESNKKSL